MAPLASYFRKRSNVSSDDLRTGGLVSISGLGQEHHGRLLESSSSRKRRRPQPHYLPSQMSFQSSCDFQENGQETGLVINNLCEDADVLPKYQKYSNYQASSPIRSITKPDPFVEPPTQAQFGPLELPGSILLENQGIPHRDEDGDFFCTLPPYSRSESAGLGLYEAKMLSSLEDDVAGKPGYNSWVPEKKGVHLGQARLEGNEEAQGKNASSDNLASEFGALFIEQLDCFGQSRLGCLRSTEEFVEDSNISSLTFSSHILSVSADQLTEHLPSQELELRDALISELDLIMGFVSQIKQWQSRTLRVNTSKTKRSVLPEEQRTYSSAPTSPAVSRKRSGLALQKLFDEHVLSPSPPPPSPTPPPPPESPKSPASPPTNGEADEDILPTLSRVHTPVPLPSDIEDAYVKLRGTYELQSIDLYHMKQYEAAAEDQIQSLKDDIAKMAAEIIDLQRKNDNLEMLFKDCTSMINKSNTCIDAQKAEIEELRKTLAIEKKMISVGTIWVLHAKREKRKLKAEVERLEAEKVCLQDRLDKTTAKLCRMEMESNSELFNADVSGGVLLPIPPAGPSIKALEKEIEYLNWRITQYEAKATAMMSDNKAAKQKVQFLQGEITKLSFDLTCKVHAEKSLARSEALKRANQDVSRPLPSLPVSAESSSYSTSYPPRTTSKNAFSNMGGHASNKNRGHDMRSFSTHASATASPSIAQRRNMAPEPISTHNTPGHPSDGFKHMASSAPVQSQGMPINSVHQGQNFTKSGQKGERYREHQTPYESQFPIDDDLESPAGVSLYTTITKPDVRSRTASSSHVHGHHFYSNTSTGPTIRTARPVSMSPATPKLVTVNPPRRANSTRVSSQRETQAQAYQTHGPPVPTKASVIEPDIVYRFGSRGAAQIERANSRKASSTHRAVSAGPSAYGPASIHPPPAPGPKHRTLKKTPKHKRHAPNYFDPDVTPANVTGIPHDDPFGIPDTPTSPKSRSFREFFGTSDVRLKEYNVDEHGNGTITLNTGEKFDMVSGRLPTPAHLSRPTNVAASSVSDTLEDWPHGMDFEESPTVTALKELNMRRARAQRGNVHAQGEPVAGGVVGETGDGSMMGYF